MSAIAAHNSARPITAGSGLEIVPGAGGATTSFAALLEPNRPSGKEPAASHAQAFDRLGMFGQRPALPASDTAAEIPPIAGQEPASSATVTPVHVEGEGRTGHPGPQAPRLDRLQASGGLFPHPPPPAHGMDAGSVPASAVPAEPPPRFMPSGRSLSDTRPGGAPAAPAGRHPATAKAPPLVLSHDALGVTISARSQLVTPEDRMALRRRLAQVATALGVALAEIRLDGLTSETSFHSPTGGPDGSRSR